MKPSIDPVEFKATPGGQHVGQRKRHWKGYVAIAALAIAIGTVLHLTYSGPAEAAAPPPTPQVGVSTPVEKRIEPRLEFLGQVSAVENVELRAQVGGTLTKIHFKDGEVVHAGDVLFEIDKTPYEIKLAQATAQLESANARLSLANRQFERAKQLKETDAGSVENVDQATAERSAAQASVSGAQALVRDAKFDLDRCTIVAPFTGRIGTHLVSVGNLISGSRAGTGPTTLLATIVSVDPVYVNFDMSEADYMTFLKNREKNSGPLSDNVYVALTGETTFGRTGKMTFLDNALDHGSGTIHARATLSNPDLLLTPGGFARVRLALTAPKDVLLVPDEAVFADQTEHAVMVVGTDGKAVLKKVQIGGLRGGLRVILTGLVPSDKVIVDGLPKVTPGGAVATKPVSVRFDAAQDQG